MTMRFKSFPLSHRRTIWRWHETLSKIHFSISMELDRDIRQRATAKMDKDI
jgi:hypothetical protein